MKLGDDKLMAAIEEHLVAVNELMPADNPHGAWALGLLTAHGLEIGRFAPRCVLEAAAAATSLSGALTVLQTVEQFTQQARRRRV